MSLLQDSGCDSKTEPHDQGQCACCILSVRQASIQIAARILSFLPWNPHGRIALSCRARACMTIHISIGMRAYMYTRSLQLQSLRPSC